MKMPWILYGTAWKKERTTVYVEQALHAGFRGIDTANQLKHYSEKLVGDALKDFKREELFLQTKFTSLDGQDERLPYEENADIPTQVEQSFKSSLEHLRTDYLDSYLLHGPYGHPGLIDEDWQVWGALEKLHQAGKAKLIGISNVNALQLDSLVRQAKQKPQVVQNRCYANRGWDREVRKICLEHQILYQGFSLLTANPYVLDHPKVLEISQRWNAIPEQVIFRFSQQIGMHPLTGTTSPEHMKQDLASREWELTPEETKFLETIVG